MNKNKDLEINKPDSTENLDTLKKEISAYERQDFKALSSQIKAQGDMPIFTPTLKEVTTHKKRNSWLKVAAAVLLVGVISITTILVTNKVDVKIGKDFEDLGFVSTGEKDYNKIYIALNQLKNEDSFSSLSRDMVAYSNAATADSAAGFGETDDFVEYYDSGSDFDAPSPEEEFGGDYGETNVQVEGIDEADIMKNDGKNLYVLSSHYSEGNNYFEQIISVVRGSDLEILSQLKLNSELYGNIVDMYVKNGKLITFSNLYSERNDEIASSNSSMNRMIYYFDNDTYVRIYDISGNGELSLAREFAQEGSYVSSRLSEETVYFVTTKHVSNFDGLTEDTITTYVPHTRENADSDFEPVAANCIAISADPSNTFVVASALSITEDIPASTQTLLSANGYDIYANKSNLYVVSYNYNNYNDSDYVYEVSDSVQSDFQRPSSSSSSLEIARFSLDGNNINFEARGSVPGFINNQFSLDERNGFLRVAVTYEYYTSELFSTANRLFILDSDMKIVGSTEDLADGESIKSVRYMGDMAYIVTFRQTDPLFAIDTSDPYNPKVLGELKIPGFSTYMHPLDEYTLVGLGFDADEETGGTMGLKLSMFDVSDPLNPTEIHKLIIGNSANSDATYQHKAFTYIKSKGILAIPYNLYQDAVIGNQTVSMDYSEGLMVFTVSKENGFALKGIMNDPKALEEIDDLNTYYDYNRSFTRSTYIGDTLYAISNISVVAADLNSLEFINQVDLYEVEKMKELSPSPTPAGPEEDLDPIIPFENYVE